MILSFERRHCAGQRLSHLGGGGGGNSGSSQAELLTAIKASELSAEQLAWAKEVYANEAPARDKAQATADAVSAAQLEGMRSTNAMSSDMYADYKQNYQPLEREIIAEARGYDTDARREQAAGAATADVAQGFSIATDAAARDLQRSGVNVNDGKAMAVRGQLVAQEALARANAANQARKQVETVGAAKRADAANLGRNIASTQGTSAALALNQGNSAVANSGAAIAAMQSGNAQMNQGYAGAQAGLAGAARTYGRVAGRDAAAASASSAASSSNAAAGVGAAATIGAAVII